MLKLLSLFALLFLAKSMNGQTVNCNCGNGFMPYKVQAGDSCAALDCGDGRSVWAANGNLGGNAEAWCRSLQVGQVICIPSVVQNNNGVWCARTHSGRAFGAAGECGNWNNGGWNNGGWNNGWNGCYSRTIQSGDTCYGICNNNWDCVSAMQRANPHLNCNNLQIGQTVCGNWNWGANNGWNWNTWGWDGRTGNGWNGCGARAVGWNDNCWNNNWNWNNDPNWANNLYAANRGLDCNNLRQGQIVCGNWGDAYWNQWNNGGWNPNPPRVCGTTRITWGDNCNTIAARCGGNGFASNSFQTRNGVSCDDWGYWSARVGTEVWCC
jgi:hypothetical protein